MAEREASGAGQENYEKLHIYAGAEDFESIRAAASKLVGELGLEEVYPSAQAPSSKTARPVGFDPKPQTHVNLSSLPTPHSSLLSTHYSLLTTYYSLLTTYYLLLTTLYPLLTTHYSLLTTHYSLLTFHYSLLATH